jgi:hypothetical protein
LIGRHRIEKSASLATQSIDLDQRRLGMTTWCESRKASLAGFVRTKN